MAKQLYKEYRVLDLPTSGLQKGDRYYLNVGANKYQTYIVSDSLQLTKEAGAEFIEKDTMAEMRALSLREIWALQNGYYKGVKLNGYYAKDDTPATIEYYPSETTEIDNGGSVIVVGSIKLEHIFINKVDVSYFGAKENELSNNQIQACEEYCYGMNLVLDWGYKTYKINQSINLRCECVESGCTLQVQDNPLVALTVNGDNVVLFNRQYELPSLINISKPSVGYLGVNSGIKIYDLNSCRIFTKEISNFNDGFFMSANVNRGNSYNTVFIGHHRNNKHNITLIPENSGGWCNENMFIGGRLSKLSHEVGDGKVQDVFVVDGGSGYTTASITLTNTGTGSGFSATPNISSGIITSFTITNAGSGYPQNLSATLTGDGTGGSIRLVVAEPDSTQIRMEEDSTGTGGGVDNCLFNHISLEGNNVHRHVYCEGRNNLFENCRWETPNSRPQVTFNKRSNSTSGGSQNEILDGYGVDTLFLQETNGARWNRISRGRMGYRGVYFNQAMITQSSNGTSHYRMYGSVGNILNRNGLTDNGWSTDIGAFGYKGKSISDNYPKIFLDNESGKIHLGGGNVEIVPFITTGVGTPEGAVFAPVGSLYINRAGAGVVGNNLYIKTTANNYNDGWILSNYKPNATPTSRGVVLQAGISADSATAPSATYTQTEVQSILTELRDLKSKLRSAGILAT